MDNIETKAGVLETGTKDSFGGDYKDSRLLSFKNRTATDYAIAVDTVVICDRAFFGLSEIRTIMLPDSVRAIGESAFTGCRNLTEINIPEGVEIIKQGTFRDCRALERLMLPSSLKFIDKFAFARGLKSLIILSPDVEFASMALFGTADLQEIVVPAQSVARYEAALKAMRVSVKVSTLSDEATIESTPASEVLPEAECENTESIDNNMVACPHCEKSINSDFAFCPYCASPISGLTEAGDASGREDYVKTITPLCAKISEKMSQKGLSEFVIPASEDYYDDEDSYDEQYHDDIIQNERHRFGYQEVQNTYKDYYIFGLYKDSDELNFEIVITEQTDGDGKEEVERYRLTAEQISGCNKYTWWAGKDYCELNSVLEFFIELLDRYNTSAPYEIIDDDEIEAEEDEQKYAFNVIHGKAIIPNGVTKIPINAFVNYSNLTEIHIPESVTKIGKSAFYGCAGLTEIHIPESVTKIGSVRSTVVPV